MMDDDTIDYDKYSVIINEIYLKSRQQALLDIDNELNNNNNNNNNNHNNNNNNNSNNNTISNNNNDNESSIISKPTQQPRMLALKSGLKAVNFVYGEIDNNSYIHLLSIVGINNDNETYCDLGCGAGISVVAASMMMYYNKQYKRHMKFNKIIGIDLLSMKIEECLKTINYMNSNINALRMLPNDDKYYEYIVTKTPDINIVLDNFLQNQEWKSADVVYACATVWGQDLLSQLQVQLTELKVDSRVIILDSLLLQSHESFQLIDTYLCNTTWGVATAYIYRKIS